MRRTMSKNNRVLALIATMAAASFMVGGLAFAVTSSEGATVAAATSRLADLRATSNLLDENVAEQQALLGDYVLSGNLRSKIAFDTAVAEETAAYAELSLVTADLPSAAAAVAAFQETSLQWRNEIALPAIRAVAARDASGIERFRVASISDQDTIEASVVGLSRTVTTVEAEIAARKSSVDGLTTIGAVVAFGFLLVSFGVALVAVRRFGRTLERDAQQASVLNRFTEVTSFAGDDHEIAIANLVALGRLAGPDASVIHILNRSMDRAMPEASTGPAIAEVLPLHALGRCAGVLRGTVYVTDDLSDDLSVHCPIYPAPSGTLACIPLISGESVGAVHLYWARPAALPLTLRQSISRITEHAALAIGNRRLLAALHGQANTDARTGLSNSRAFDLSLEAALRVRAKHESLSVLMLDVDHFKPFNDRHGHPAGDEALKAFAAVLRSCMRDDDVAARYGGEEFAVFLPGVDTDGAAVIAERIRARTEATIISLAPGLTDRITVSVGIATVPDQAQDRVTLLRLADEALYQAKEAGRNRVAVAGRDDAQTGDDDALSATAPTMLATARRRELAAGAGTRADG